MVQEKIRKKKEVVVLLLLLTKEHLYNGVGVL